MTNYYDLLGIAKTADQAQIRVAYIAKARQYHPDVTGGDKAKEAKFKAIVEANECLSDPEKRKRYDTLGTAAPMVIPSKRGRYTVETRIAVGDLSDVYRATCASGTVVLKIARHPTVNDLLEAEHKRLSAIWKPGADPKKYGYYYLPRPVESFMIDDGARRRVNVLSYIPDHGTFEEVRVMFPSGVNLETAVWIFNRLLEALAFVHDNGQIHGALVPSNVMIWLDPQGHLIKLLDWGYAGAIGEPIKTISPKWKAFYPPEVFGKKLATAATDIYMAARLVAFILGANLMTRNFCEFPSAVPAYLQRFLKGCFLLQDQRPQNAWELHEEFKLYMEKHYGAKRFIPFTNPAWTGT